MGGGQQPQVQYSVLGLGYPICKMGLILVLLWEAQAQVLEFWAMAGIKLDGQLCNSILVA